MFVKAILHIGTYEEVVRLLKTDLSKIELSPDYRNGRIIEMRVEDFSEMKKALVIEIECDGLGRDPCRPELYVSMSHRYY